MHAWRTQWLAGTRAPSVRHPHVPHAPRRGLCGGATEKSATEPSPTGFAAAQASRRSPTAARARRCPTASTSPFSSGPSRRRSPMPRRAARPRRLAACRARPVACCMPPAVCCIVRIVCCMLLVARLLAACCMLHVASQCHGVRAILSSCRCGARAVGGGRCTCRPQKACSAHSVGSASAFSPMAPARGVHTQTHAHGRIYALTHAPGRIRTWAHAHGRASTHARTRLRPSVCLRGSADRRAACGRVRSSVAQALAVLGARPRARARARSESAARPRLIPVAHLGAARDVLCRTRVCACV